jgi:Fic family protein
MKKNIGQNIGQNEPTSLMEPMLPPVGDRVLEDLAIDLVEKGGGLASRIHPITQNGIGDLVRSMNCYYSNLIEGHDTHPRDIEKALAKNFSRQPKQRDLQMEAKAHIEVQRWVDHGAVPEDLTEENYILEIHRRFCERLPESLLWVEDPDSKERIKILPGKLRDRTVVVGRHIPPRPAHLAKILARFNEAYRPANLSKLQRVLAIAASHHRLLWIHPFLDGNGRVTRLLSHAYFKYLGVGNALWSVSRGLARSVSDYKAKLEAADEARQGDLDGRGSLSLSALRDFCEYFLKTCLDQVTFMASLLEPSELMRRIQLYCEDEERAERLPKKSFMLLREALLVGEFDRGRVGEITGYSERQGRRVLSELEGEGLLKSETPKGPVRLAFPVKVVERWFPRLYPV